MQCMTVSTPQVGRVPLQDYKDKFKEFRMRRENMIDIVPAGG